MQEPFDGQETVEQHLGRLRARYRGSQAHFQRWMDSLADNYDEGEAVPDAVYTFLEVAVARAKEDIAVSRAAIASVRENQDPRPARQWLEKKGLKGTNSRQ